MVYSSRFVRVIHNNKVNKLISNDSNGSWEVKFQAVNGFFRGKPRGPLRLGTKAKHPDPTVLITEKTFARAAVH